MLNHLNIFTFTKVHNITIGYSIWFYFVLFLSAVISFQVHSLENEKSELSLKQLLLMPGKLTLPHAKIENKCQECHLHFDKKNQSPLCLTCHKEINKDLKQAKGFHSSIDEDKIKQCNDCHTDHKGRDHDITSLDKSAFDHNKTEFSLQNSHLALTCNQCHKPGDKNFRIELKKGQCISCHDDPHQGELKDDCSQCHDNKSWQETTFDHNETEFKLKNKHEELSCQSCHVNDVSTDIGSECVTCHLSKDKHLNTMGEKCQSCHSEEGWEKIKYDHFKETKFKLLGKHQKLSCEGCHTESIKKNNKMVKLETKCNGCHVNDDIHLGNNGTKCQSCHNNDDWGKAEFNHSEETNFMLKEAHKDLTCESCHLPQRNKNSAKRKLDNQQRTISRTCNDCHELNDAHDGKLGKDCQRCHQQQKWHEQVTFNHDFTLFPLMGAHQLEGCQSCHFSSDFSVEKFTCIDCHQDTDVHEKTLGTKCQECHNSASWSSWQFDHQEKTDYPLEGEHNKLACGLCHRVEDKKPLSPPKECISCHQNDDAHQGAFGRNCQQCHTTESFYDFKH